MNHQHEIEKMKLIKDDLEKLNQKQGQYQGVLVTLKTQAKDMSQQILADHKLTIDEIPNALSKLQQETNQDEKRIVNDFTKLYNQDHIRTHIKISEPFNVEAINDEIQNNLLSIKSQAEGEIKGLEQQQEKLRTNLQQEFNIDINNVDSFLNDIALKMQELSQEIQSKYADITQDDEIKKLLQ
jgi:predicted outer membrane protein